MMKKELLYVVACVLILMPLSVSHVAAQGNETRDEGELSEDSVVNIIAYFSKNDTLTYVYDYQEMSVVNGDTVSVRKLSRDISIVVTDSTENGYMLELISTDIHADKNIKKSFFEKKFFESIKGEKVIVKLDEYGALQGISNWKELYDKGKTLLNDEANTTDKETLKGLKRMFDNTIKSEQGMMGMFPELDLLFGSHGIQVMVGENNFVDSVSSEIPVTYKYIAYNDYEEDGTYAGCFTMALSETVIPKERFSGLLARGLSNVGFGKEKKIEGSIGEFFNKELDGDVDIKGYESREYYFVGWPRKTVTFRDSGTGNNRSITARRISCTSYSLFNY